MHKAGVTHFHFHPDKLNEATEIWEGLIEAARHFEGFKGCLLLTNQLSGKVIGIGLWEDRAHASRFGNSEIYQDYMKKLSDLQESPPTREQYELQRILIESIDLLTDFDQKKTRKVG